ncbi:hypothetical protein [Vibrio lentus]|uniref:hypothetical protein n=1 Tax=Vibrio lentus TaxID=136468 RepID=UPI0010BDCE5D|nr:hypothetical protein [Vibrio lentus]TKG17752.1 hypothetical protein FCW05_12665 [Vibrio lentus]
MDNYNADSIRILSPEELAAKAFPWDTVEQLVDRYTAPKETVQRGIEACFFTNTPVDYYENRYLKNDRTVPIIQEHYDAYLELMRA